MLKPYVLTERQMEENKFPMDAEVCNIVYRRDRSSVEEKLCSRCNKLYTVTGSGVLLSLTQCVFHPGMRVNLSEGCVYTCCQRTLPWEGCEVSKYHVSSWKVCEVGFVETLSQNELPSDAPLLDACALDCEMCYTTKGLEVTQVSLVDLEKRPVYTTFVKPQNIITDYNTRYSGVTAKDLQDVTTNLMDVQVELLRRIHSGTVVIGHALDIDFRVLGLVHRQVIDTSVMFPHTYGPPRKYSLKTLATMLLHRNIEHPRNGHKSTEEAATCIDLVLHKIMRDQTIP